MNTAPGSHSDADSRGQRPDARARILDAALQLFADAGFDATPVSRVAATADVPKALVHYYFPAKLDVLLTLARERTAADVMRLSAGDELAGLPLERLLPYLATRLGSRLGEEGPLPRILLREANTHPEIRERLDELFTGARSDLTAALRTARPHAGAADLEAAAHLAAATLFLHGLNLRDLHQVRDELAGTGALLDRALEAA